MFYRSLFGQKISCSLIPQGDRDLERFEVLISKKQPFTFVRFSDGEIEVIRNRKVVIGDNITHFRGRVFRNSFPNFDRKIFDPSNGQNLRRDLMSAATFKDSLFYKGIPTSHNNMLVEREMMLRLNGGADERLTFADLFLNSNYVNARKVFFPMVIEQFSNLFVVGNYRCNLSSELKHGRLVSIPDNFFSDYQNTLHSSIKTLSVAPDFSLVLSSASSLSNILGHKLRMIRPDITFLDVGTAINDLIGLPLSTRAYHRLLDPRGFVSHIQAFCYKYSREYKLRW